MPIYAESITKNEYKNMVLGMISNCKRRVSEPYRIRLKNRSNNISVYINCANNYLVSSYMVNNDPQIVFDSYNYEVHKVCSFINAIDQFVYGNKSSRSFKRAKETIIFYFSEAARSEVIFKHCYNNLYFNANENFSDFHKTLITTYGHVINHRDNHNPSYERPLTIDNYINYFNSNSYTGSNSDSIIRTLRGLS